jgi:hypothetical protein
MESFNICTKLMAKSTGSTVLVPGFEAVVVLELATEAKMVPPMR